MRMYTLHFGHGLEGTEIFDDMVKGNIPYLFEGWSNGDNPVDTAASENARIVSHREIYERYGIKGGHGQFCLETWTGEEDRKAFSARMYTGGYGDLTLSDPQDVSPFYLKFDFMYTQTTGGTVIGLYRDKTGDVSNDLNIDLLNGYLQVQGVRHYDVGTSLEGAWLPNSCPRGSIYLEPNKWHTIQIFVAAYQGWNASEKGPSFSVDPFTPAFVAYENTGNFYIHDAEDLPRTASHPLRMETWPSNGHPKFPHSMLPGNDQSVFPPENYGSGQYFYGDALGLVYIWVNGQLDIHCATNMSNEQTGWQSAFSRQSIFLGFEVDGSDPDDDASARFFYDNVIWNDIRDPSGTLPSKIFNPLFSTDESLEWNPGYNLKFTAMEFNESYWASDEFGDSEGRYHDIWYPDFPRGALVPSGTPYYVPAPNRYGAPTNGMIPHDTKLTVIHLDWDGDEQDYSVEDGLAGTYPDYDINYTYQHLHPEESNPFFVNQDDPRIESTVAGNKALFYVTRPPATSGKQPVPGGFGLGGVKNYVPNINSELGHTQLPGIYRIWTCIQDHSTGSTLPIDTQVHLIRVPSGVSGYVDYVSDNPCPGDRGYRAYTNGTASLSNGYCMADWPYNPVTGNPWTWDDLDELQIGVMHSGHGGGSNRAITYTVYLVVEHATVKEPESSILGDNLLKWSLADDVPFIIQQKSMHIPGWKSANPRENFGEYYNRWEVSPSPSVTRIDSYSNDGQATIETPAFSGVTTYDYKIRYINGDIVPGNIFREFDESFDPVWVYNVGGISPSTPIRRPMRGEIITDADGNYFTFLGYPVLQYNEAQYPTDPNLSPLTEDPYVVYDYGTLYVIPLRTHNRSSQSTISAFNDDVLNPDQMPKTSGSLGVDWTINKQQNVFNHLIEKDSYFKPFSPSSVANHQASHPEENLDLSFPSSRTGHDYYFQAPNLASGSVSQTIFLVDEYGLSSGAIDNQIYNAHIGLYQATTSEAANDTGEGRFDFYSGDPSNDTLISGYTFGADGTASWHLNEANVTIPSGTRQVVFTFIAIRNTDSGSTSPGGTLGGTTNFACFDEAFFEVSIGSGYTGSTYHPADLSQNNQITREELATYTSLWQSGNLPTGQGKDYLSNAELIWKQGVQQFNNEPSGGLYSDANDYVRPDNWTPSGV